MTKTKWHSKLLSLSIAFALVFSLVAMVVPVSTIEAQQPYNVNVTTEYDAYCCCDTFNVTADIGQVGVNQTDVSAMLTINGDAVLEEGSNPAIIGNITQGSTGFATWVVHCTGEDDAEFSVNVTSVETPGGIIGTTTVTQEQCGHLEVDMIYPLESQEPLIVSVCNNFTLQFKVKNDGTVPLHGLFVNVQLIGDNMERAIDGSTSWTKLIVEDLDPGETTANTYETKIHCTGTGPGVVHIEPYGENECGYEIVGTSEVIRIEQIFGIKCDAEDTKVGHNSTFSAVITGANMPIDYTWDFDGTGSNNKTVTGYGSPIISETWGPFTSDGTYTATICVTDASNTTVCCNSSYDVYPALNMTCDVSSNVTKLGHCVNFTAMRDGGLDPGVRGANYTWEWAVTNSTMAVVANSTAANWTWCPSVTGNYTGTVTLKDNSALNNTATCSKNVTVYAPLDVSCNISATETKVGHSVNFTAERIGGFPEPPASYTWYWDFGDSCGTSTQQNPTYTYTMPGNYTPTVTLSDNFPPFNNTATCNKTIVVHPGLNVTCNVTPDPQNVCHAVNFTAEREGGVPGNSYNWTWEFSDGTTAVGQNVTKTFMCIGNYTGTVTLTDEDLGNTANCTAEVEIIIEPPELIAPELNETVLSRWVTFNWTDIGCCNYTLEVWQKDGAQVKVLLADTGKDSFWSGWIMDGDKYKWQVTATDSCGNSATSEAWYFEVQDTYLDVSVDAPMTGDSFPCDSTTTIIWSTTRDDSFAGFGASGDEEIEVALYYSTNSGTDWTSIATGQAGTGSIAWAVPAAVNSDQCLIKAVASDGYGNEGVGISGLFSIVCIVEPDLVTSYNITLNEGWNLISLPLIPTSNNISAVLAGAFGTGNITQVWAYDPSLLPGDAWLSYYTFLPWSANELKEMNDGVGYWIVVQGGTATLTINGQCMPDPGEVPPMYDVYAGWNLIGMKSLATRAHDVYLANVSGMYTVIWAYDTVSGNYELVYPTPPGSGLMNPGEGFWIYMQADGVIVPTGC